MPEAQAVPDPQELDQQRPHSSDLGAVILSRWQGFQRSHQQAMVARS